MAIDLPVDVGNNRIKVLVINGEGGVTSLPLEKIAWSDLIVYGAG